MTIWSGKRSLWWSQALTILVSSGQVTTRVSCLFAGFTNAEQCPLEKRALRSFVVLVASSRDQGSSVPISETGAGNIAVAFETERA
ncbi:hypothetical protein P152DRAFT_457971 [Eremomyces bilateralis CBS 781.70]|uniref:Secreted protein n=1 Tax=Eremomyces bilateralis CBS 781.70 TaxID=1392243 RepID=A0A6G1G4D2_9PEZI|nr:uncharacterized protein P152DRAFT_457971 [Eremomyces bilateralis CBS 781.70]KAF1812770.1 hypothetical protein P152DRAFT_457971 [Eremomyces bilateralis CBS 781.70]